MSAVQLEIIPSFPFSESAHGLQDHDESIQVPARAAPRWNAVEYAGLRGKLRPQPPSLSPFVAF